MRRILLVIVFIVLSVFAYTKLKPNEIHIHYHAGFQVYKDDVLQDFSGLEYMNISPCSETEEEKELTPEELQLEKGHLHDNIGDVVHVHHEGAVWGDLFRNIKVEINTSEAYINGEKIEDILSYPIKAYDSLVLFEGEKSSIEEKLKNTVTKEHILEAESKSENCGS